MQTHLQEDMLSAFRFSHFKTIYCATSIATCRLVNYCSSVAVLKIPLATVTRLKVLRPAFTPYALYIGLRLIKTARSTGF